MPESSNERVLFRSIHEIIRAIELDHSERQGMAFIAALEVYEIRFDDGRQLGAFPLEVGIEDICRVLAFELSDVQPDPIVWKANYPLFLMDPTLNKERDQLRDRIARLSFVMDIL